MTTSNPPLQVRVWGDFACFTDIKVDPYSYQVMTPSAARGILESIFWLPNFHWEVREIHVLRPIQSFSIARNEIDNRASVRVPYIYIGRSRIIRHSLILRDVAYLIKADIVLNAGEPEQNLSKYRDMFRRRVDHGKCFRRPYLGCREFAADFGPARPNESPIQVTKDLGRMLFDMDYRGGSRKPRRFQAKLEAGVLRVPPELYRRSGEVITCSSSNSQTTLP